MPRATGAAARRHPSFETIAAVFRSPGWKCRRSHAPAPLWRRQSSRCPLAPPKRRVRRRLREPVIERRQRCWDRTTRAAAIGASAISRSASARTAIGGSTRPSMRSTFAGERRAIRTFALSRRSCSRPDRDIRYHATLPRAQHGATRPHGTQSPSCANTKFLGDRPSRSREHKRHFGTRPRHARSSAEHVPRSPTNRRGSRAGR
ncbi:MAG: hypothetical protein JWO85_1802 [Candidatus Eremiobacteraeota bacterium]|nr:hypothetical protein [Candidatus Eremiobacteraeota bacterium]